MAGGTVGFNTTSRNTGPDDLNIRCASVSIIGASTAGQVILGEGTAPSLTANKITMYAPTDVAVGGINLCLPGTAFTGVPKWTNSSGTMTMAQATAGTDYYNPGGTDVAVADGGTGLSSGTSGGVLAFTASGTLASSAALAANAIVIGGGAGAVPSTTTTGSGVLTALGNTANATGGVLTTNGTASPTNKTYATWPVEICVACSDETTAITTGTAKATFRAPFAFTLTAVRASVTTAPTGSTIIIDINEAGTTVISTKLMIDASEKTSTTAASAAVISDSAIADDAELTIDFDQVGSTIAGAGVKVWLLGTRSVTI